MQAQENPNVPFLMAAAAFVVVVALAASPASARVTGGAGMGASVGAQSNTHISTQGMANSNGVNASDRDTGTLRADDRASANGLKHGRRLAKGHAHTDTDGDSR